MSNNPNQPRPDDAVLGGQSPPPTSSVILGGLEGVKWRLKNQSQEVRIAALSEALKYGSEGLKVLADIIETDMGIAKWVAYNFLWERVDNIEKDKLRKYSFKVVSPESIEQGMVQQLGRGSINNVIILSNELLVVCASGGAALLNVHSGERLWEIDCPAECGAMNSNGTLLALGGRNRNICLWDLRTGKLLQQLEGHTDSVKHIAFSPNGRLLASGSWDNTVRLWDVASGKLVRQLEGHTAEGMRCVAFSPDGKLLASGSWNPMMRFWNDGVALGNTNGRVQLWDVASGKLVRQLEGHTAEGMRCVAFSPDGKLLALGTNDEMVRLWKLD